MSIYLLRVVIFFQEAEQEKAQRGQEEKQKLNKLKEQLELEYQTIAEEMDKKQAYRLEQVRQEFADRHEKVCAVCSSLVVLLLDE